MYMYMTHIQMLDNHYCEMLCGYVASSVALFQVAPLFQSILPLHKHALVVSQRPNTNIQYESTSLTWRALFLASSNNKSQRKCRCI
jgi:hypothetical protein